MIRLGHVEINDSSIDQASYALYNNLLGQTDVVQKFEAKMAEWAGAKYAVATASGTMADAVALAVLKYLSPGKDEVIVPALTFVAQTNAVFYNQLKPVFVDVFPDFNMCVQQVKQKLSSKTLAIFPVHLLGRPADILSLTQMARAAKVYLLEDACEAMGSEYYLGGVGWRKCGTFGDMGTFSFFPSHTITTGEGGCIVTDNKEMADLCRKFINHGKIDSYSFHFDAVGFNGKMSSLQAAVGLGALEGADATIEARRRVYEALGGRVKDGTKICPHALPLEAKDREHRDALLRVFREYGIECRNIFSSLPSQETVYKHLGFRPGDFPYAEDIGNRGLYIPCHQGLSENDIENLKKAMDVGAVKVWPV